ncbi:xanthine/uracil/vitamin C permease [Candidatus Arthromitus sp. SFB-mouse-Japan]|uniref:NCS2 family permease n=1 Tax=unclassified Candidatus Neoarthromitus TaxID=2638829 RepID=UPI00021B8049|nr:MULTISPECIES: NCS2 family permease [unclassified Candidatus Arthromitus]EIA23208.1 Putative Xanthine/uracil/vitamin C permease [Candidatus Arthromitus sp. SFB-3]EIA25962.1 Xanthine/uracil/vitamin C permease [Candidatus Arthromitus sp. SFB-4]EIA30688.1 Xanthine/uracil/vitamin C permease [Candidatus Arthromitus sp. SFB-mouse-SU]EIA31487.1 Xanthine/uracil/vitamin C permease [Candidatus Arthromitus sp. SFB-5]AID44587.1 Xanthine/uracil/thiamine/ascorbate permease [Candidatus Arthromitus sp. SFB-
MLNKFFKLEERGTTVSKEFIGGLTTFLSMAYIIFVNPNILSVTGMDQGAVFTSTILAAAIGTLIMGLHANFPVALAPGMGLNAFFAYTVVLLLGYTWQQALAGIFISGILFMILSLTGLREIIINSIPTSLKHAVGTGIGFFIAFLGFQNAGIIVNNDSTLVGLGDFTDFSVLIAIIGLVITLILMVRKIPAAIFIGMVITAIIGIFLGVVDLPQQVIAPIPSISQTFGALFEALPTIFSKDIILVIFSFLFIDFFDTAGTLMAVGFRAGFVNEKGELLRANKALLADSTATVIGAILGTSSTTSYVESLAGVEVGAKTGLASVFTSIFFLLMLFCSGLLTVVTPSVTAPALITVGVLMASSLSNIEWGKIEIAIPAFITIIMMVLGYSISEGIASGFVLYPIMMWAAGRRKEVHPIMWVLTLIFLVHFIFL